MYFIILLGVLVISVRIVGRAWKTPKATGTQGVNEVGTTTDLADRGRPLGSEFEFRAGSGEWIEDEYGGDGNLSSEEVTQPKPLIVTCLWYLSLTCYLGSLIMPLSDSPLGGGAWALAVGIFLFPLWIPNPLYFCGLLYARRNRRKPAFIYAALSTAVSGFWILTNPFFHPRNFLDWTGPIAYVWFASMLLLLLACLIDWAALPSQQPWAVQNRDGL